MQAGQSLQSCRRGGLRCWCGWGRVTSRLRRAAAALAAPLLRSSRSCLVGRRHGRRRHKLRSAFGSGLRQRLGPLAALLCQLLNHSVSSGQGGRHLRALPLSWRVGWVGAAQVQQRRQAGKRCLQHSALVLRHQRPQAVGQPLCGAVEWEGRRVEVRPARQDAQPPHQQRASGTPAASCCPHSLPPSRRPFPPSKLTPCTHLALSLDSASKSS